MKNTQHHPAYEYWKSDLRNWRCSWFDDDVWIRCLALAWRRKIPLIRWLFFTQQRRTQTDPMTTRAAARYLGARVAAFSLWFALLCRCVVVIVNFLYVRIWLKVEAVGMNCNYNRTAVFAQVGDHAALMLLWWLCFVRKIFLLNTLHKRCLVAH